MGFAQQYRYLKFSHIHIRVTAVGFQEFVTQHYPVAGEAQATFNLVIVPEDEGA